MSETTSVLDENEKIANLEGRITEINALINENKKAEAFEKLQKLDKDINDAWTKGMRERNMTIISNSMKAKQEVSAKISRGSLEVALQAQEEVEESAEENKCMIPNLASEGVIPTFLAEDEENIVLHMENAKLKYCISREYFTPDILRNALVRTCDSVLEDIYDNSGQFLRQELKHTGGYSQELYINMRKFLGPTSAIVNVEEFLGYLVGDTSNKEFVLTRVKDSEDLIESFGLGFGINNITPEIRGQLSEIDMRMKYDILLPRPPGDDKDLVELYENREIVDPNTMSLLEAVSMISAAHCQPGQEKVIFSIKPKNGEFDYKAKYNELIEGNWKKMFRYPIDEFRLNQLSGPLAALGVQFVQAAADADYEEDGYGYADYEEDEYQETEDMKALIKCALANYFKKNGAFEEYTADRFDNTILNDFQNYELKLKAIFGGKWVEDKSPEEHGGLQIDFDEDQITSEKLRQVTIDYINREDNNQPVSVKRKELDWVVSASAQVYNTIIADLQEKLLSKIEDEMNRGLKLMDTKDMFNALMQSMIDRYCSSEDRENITIRLFPDSQEVSSNEGIIKCAFGEYYRTGGTFDQKKQKENGGVAVADEHLNEMKVKHIYSKHWVNVVLFGGDDECLEEEMQQTPDQCIYITPEVLEDIAKDYVEKRFRERKISEEERQAYLHGIRSFGVENTKRELGDLKRKLYDRIQEALDQTQRPAEEFMIINEEDRSQDAPTPELITICGVVISSFSDDLVSRNCNRSLPAVTESVDYDLSAQPDVDDDVDEFWRQQQYRENEERMAQWVSESGDVLTPEDGGRMSHSDLNGGKKKKRRKTKKGKKTKKKKAKKNKKKTKRRVQFNLKNNEYYTITPKNKIKKNKKRGTRKKKH